MRKPKPVYGSLTVLSELAPDKHRHRIVLAQCVCGSSPKPVRLSHLAGGKIVSCGCFRDVALLTHGMSYSRAYKSWLGIKSRVSGGISRSPHIYIDRGIDADPRWLESFDAFYADMGEPPTERHSVDREDNDKGYWPENCRWATHLEQMHNLRANVWVQLDGECVVQAEAARRLRLTTKTFRYRFLRYGWSPQKTTDYYSAKRHIPHG